MARTAEEILAAAHRASGAEGPVPAFSGEWAVNGWSVTGAKGTRILLFKDNGHTDEDVLLISLKTSAVREHLAASPKAVITVQPLTLAEFQADCEHMFLDADGECQRCGTQTGMGAKPEPMTMAERRAMYGE